MQIIIRFILKNIYEKKFRTFLILLSVTISAALFFASSAMTDTMVKMFIDRMKNYYGNAEILIHSKEKSPSPYLYTAGAQKFSDHMEYVIGLFQGSATYNFKKDETVSVNLIGADINDFQNMNPVFFEEEMELTPFIGKKILISKNTAAKYGLKLGDTWELDIRGNRHKFAICGICAPTGIFFDDGTSTYGIVPRETLSVMFNAKGRVNQIGLKLKNPQEKQQMIKALSEEYPRYMVREPFSKEEMKRNTQEMTTAFLLMAIIVSIMSIFIIYTSFKVVTMERLPVIGTFRSIGATRKTTDLVLLAESVLYGVAGGILGCGLGIGILYIMAIVNTPVWAKGYSPSIEFTGLQLLSAFGFAIALSFASCILPIIKVSKIPVKDIVLNSIDKQKKNRLWKLFAGIGLIGFALAAPPMAPKELAFAIDVSGMIFSVMAVILLVPFITALFVKLFERIYSYIFGNIGSLAAKNLRENKSILTNISLLAIGISSLLMITSVSDSVITELSNFYRTSSFELWVMNLPQADRNIIPSLMQVEGVEDVYPIYAVRGVEVNEQKGQNISIIEGVDKNKFESFWKIDFVGDRSSLIQELDEGKNIILTSTLQEKFGLKTGDIITLRMKTGMKPYKVIGFMNTLRNNGSYGLISERFLKADADLNFYFNIFIKTSKNPDEVAKSVQSKYARRRPFMRTVKQMEALEKQSNSNMFTILQGFSVLALVIGIFGVLNNLIISFIERKRSLAMLRSIGMNRGQIIRMIFIESLTGGFIGGLVGIFTGFLMLSGVPYVMKAMNMTMPIHYPFGTLWIYLLAGIAITLAASISPAIRSSKLNIIEAIKYE